MEISHLVTVEGLIAALVLNVVIVVVFLIVLTWASQ